MEDEPISTPESPLPDYDGGFGTPLPDDRDSRCRTCQRQRKSCEDSVDNGREQCAMDQGRYWRNVCTTDLRFRGGQRIPQSLYECIEFGVEDEGSGMCFPGEEVCQGPGIDRCVADYMDSHPSMAWTSSYTIRVGPEFFGLGGGHSFEIQWGGTMGARDACNQLGSQAATVCTERHTMCSRQAGGCSNGS
jgi:hypothetical protein